MKEIILVPLPNSYEWDLEKEKLILESISEDKKNRLLRFRDVKDRMRGLLAEIIIRETILNEYLARNEELVFDINEFGKPFLKSHDLNLQYSVSHSSEWIVVAFSNHSIGVDVERIRNFDLEIAESFFATEEVHLLYSEADKDFSFCKLWTLKESYMKFLGKGLYEKLDSFAIDYTNEPPSLIRSENNDSPRFDFLEGISGYCLSICSESLEKPRYCVLNHKKLIHNFLNRIN